PHILAPLIEAVPQARRSPLGLKTTERFKAPSFWRAVDRFRDSSGFPVQSQTLTPPLGGPRTIAIRWASRLTAVQSDRPPGLRSRASARADASQILMPSVASADRRWRPSRLKATADTLEVCPRYTASSLPLAASQRPTRESLPAQAIRLPSGLNASFSGLRNG